MGTEPPKKKGYRPLSPGWNNFNAFKYVIPRILGTSTNYQFSQKDLKDMYTAYSGEFAEAVTEAQSTMLDTDYSRERYMKALTEQLKEPKGKFGMAITQGRMGNTDPTKGPVIQRKDSMLEWFKEEGASYREGRQNFADAGFLQFKRADPKGTTARPQYDSAAQGGRKPFGAGIGGKYQPGDYVPGLGQVSSTGAVTKGLTQNVGGGEIDTQIDTETAKGDVVSVGPLSANVATKTLRASFQIAGGEEVRPDFEENLQSDALFEAFSWVPDGYGQGPNNQLHNMNKQNEAFRFGMAPLSLPRMAVDTNMTHDVPDKWSESMPDNMITQLLAEQYGEGILMEEGFLAQEQAPLRVLDNDYNRFPSHKNLPRQATGPSPFEPVVDNTELYYPSYDPSPMVMASTGFHDSMTGTLAHRRMNVFGIQS